MKTLPHKIPAGRFRKGEGFGDPPSFGWLRRSDLDEQFKAQVWERPDGALVVFEARKDWIPVIFRDPARRKDPK